MMAGLAPALDLLQAICSQHHAPLGVTAPKGVPTTAIVTALRALELVPEDELLAWFGWRDPAGRHDLLPNNFRVRPLDQCIADCRMMREIAAEIGGANGPDDAVWRKSFFPVAGEDGDWLVVDLDPISADARVRYYYRDTGSWGAANAPCLEHVVNIWCDDIRAGLSVWDDQGLFWESKHRDTRLAPRGFTLPQA